MKRVVFTSVSLKGPQSFKGKLERTKNDNGYYADIAVLAVPDRVPSPIDEYVSVSDWTLQRHLFD